VIFEWSVSFFLVGWFFIYGGWLVGWVAGGWRDCVFDNDVKCARACLCAGFARDSLQWSLRVLLWEVGSVYHGTHSRVACAPHFRFGVCHTRTVWGWVSTPSWTLAEFLSSSHMAY
jgi:hypothetical protein